MRKRNLAIVAFTLFLLPALAHADSASPIEEPASQPGNWFVHASVGVPVVSYLGTMGSQNPAWVTPAQRFGLLQLVGAGYWVDPHVRLNLSFQFGETLTGLPAGASAFTMAGAIAWVAYTRGPFFAGVGGVVAPLSYGTWNVDAGIFMCAGAAVPLGAGFALGVAVQAPVMLVRRISWVVAPALVLSRRF